MWKLRVLILVLAGIGPSGHASDLQDQLAKCRSSSVIPKINVNPATTVLEVERIFEAARNAKLQGCGGAFQAVEKLETKVKDLSSAMAHADEAMADATARADGAIDAELTVLSEDLKQLWAVPNEPNDDNNKVLNEKVDNFDVFDRQRANLASHWNSLFAPVPGSPLDIVKAGAADKDFSAEAKQNIQIYLNGIPAYLLGEGPAPTGKLDFLASRGKMARDMGVAEKQKEYGQPIVGRADQSLEQTLEPAVAQARANVIRTKIMERFGNHTGAWAQLASASGACLLAKDVLSDQLAVLQGAEQVAPENLKSALIQVLASDIRARKDLVARANCDAKKDDALLTVALQRWQSHLSGICAHANPTAASEVKAYLNDIPSYFSDRQTVKSPNDIKQMSYLGQEIWSRGYDLAVAICTRGSP